MLCGHLKRKCILLLHKVFLKCQSHPVDSGDVQFFFLQAAQPPVLLGSGWMATPSLTLLAPWRGRVCGFLLVFVWTRVGIIKRFLFLLGHPFPDRLSKKHFWNLFSLSDLLAADFPIHSLEYMKGKKKNLGDSTPIHCPCPEVHAQDLLSTFRTFLCLPFVSWPGFSVAKKED